LLRCLSRERCDPLERVRYCFCGNNAAKVNQAKEEFIGTEMKLSGYSIATIEQALESVLDAEYSWREILDVRLVNRSTPDQAAYALIGTTEAGNEVSFSIDLPKEGLLRTDMLFGSLTVLVEVLTDALRGLEATARLIDAGSDRRSDFESVLKEYIDKEIQAQFSAENTLYKRFFKGPTEIGQSGYRIPFYEEE
jgi:hypothetical protein